MLADTHLESIAAHIEKTQPRMVVVDSVQSIYSDAIQSGAGSVTQVRDCSAQLLRLAKSQTFPLFLVGHVTKEGAIAGPRVLEHMVDTVLYLEGERFHSFRLLRSVKNRFGSTNEVGVFEMAEKGLVEVKNPSEAFLAERLPNAAGSAIAVTMEGTRPILVEVQALTSATAFAQPRRTANGVDFNRLLLITAVLSKRARVRLADQDVFVNVVGGLEVEEPAADLAIAAAIASSVRNRPVAADLALVGEIGLSGELRSVGQLPRRLNEAAKLGFTRVLVPKTVARKLDRLPPGWRCWARERCGRRWRSRWWRGMWRSRGAEERGERGGGGVSLLEEMSTRKQLRLHAAIVDAIEQRRRGAPRSSPDPIGPAPDRSRGDRRRSEGDPLQPVWPLRRLRSPPRGLMRPSAASGRGPARRRGAAAARCTPRCSHGSARRSAMSRTRLPTR